MKPRALQTLPMNAQSNRPERKPGVEAKHLYGDLFEERGRKHRGKALGYWSKEMSVTERSYAQSHLLYLVLQQMARQQATLVKVGRRVHDSLEELAAIMEHQSDDDTDDDAGDDDADDDDAGEEEDGLVADDRDDSESEQDGIDAAEAAAAASPTGVPAHDSDADDDDNNDGDDADDDADDDEGSEDEDDTDDDDDDYEGQDTGRSGARHADQHSVHDAGEDAKHGASSFSLEVEDSDEQGEASAYSFRDLERSADSSSIRASSGSHPGGSRFTYIPDSSVEVVEPGRDSSADLIGASLLPGERMR